MSWLGWKAIQPLGASWSPQQFLWCNYEPYLPQGLSSPWWTQDLEGRFFRRAGTGCKNLSVFYTSHFFQLLTNEQNRSDNFQQHTQETCGAGLQLPSTWHRNLVQAAWNTVPCLQMPAGLWGSQESSASQVGPVLAGFHHFDSASFSFFPFYFSFLSCCLFWKHLAPKQKNSFTVIQSTFLLSSIKSELEDLPSVLALPKCEQEFSTLGGNIKWPFEFLFFILSLDWN